MMRDFTEFSQVYIPCLPSIITVHEFALLPGYTTGTPEKIALRSTFVVVLVSWRCALLCPSHDDRSKISRSLAFGDMSSLAIK